MTLVALSAAYGAGGSLVGPALAERLGVPFLDRAISLAVAHELDVPLDDVAARDEHVTTGWLERLLRGFIGGDVSAPTPVPADTTSSQDFVRATEAAVRAQAASGEGVILGRGAVAILRDDPRALRVRLSGPPKQRLLHAMEIGGHDRATAERALQHADRTHAEYVRQFYGLRLDDPILYHLVVDSTAIDTETCVEVIARLAVAVAR
jgi:cytidylate kinase